MFSFETTLKIQKNDTEIRFTLLIELTSSYHVYVETEYLCLFTNRTVNSVSTSHKRNVNNVSCLLGGRQELDDGF